MCVLALPEISLLNYRFSRPPGLLSHGDEFVRKVDMPPLQCES